MTVSKYGYQYGRNRAERPVGYRDLSFFGAAPSEAPAAFDPLKGASPFTMDGNGPDPTQTVHGGQPVGDCGFVMTVNANIVTAAATGVPFVAPNSNTVVTDYLAYDHGVDKGVNNAQLLPHWHRVGLWGNKIQGYGGVNFRDYEESMAYCHTFLGLCTGIVVSEAMEEATQNGEPWDYKGTSADKNILGGHDVYVFGRTPDGLGVLATWGQRQAFTQEWWEAQVEECDAVITSELVAHAGDGLGVNIPELDAYLKSLEV